MKKRSHRFDIIDIDLEMYINILNIKFDPV